MSKKKPNFVKKPLLVKLTDEKDVQTDELLPILEHIRLADSVAECTPSSSTSPQDLTKEQLLTRLQCSQSLCQRLKKSLTKEQAGRKKEQSIFKSTLQEVKLLLHDHRHKYKIIQDSLIDSSVAFVNGREQLRQRIVKYQTTCQEEQRHMKDTIARNEVVVEKADLTLKSTKHEIERVLKLADDMRDKITAAFKEKRFIEKQYKELQEKQNKDFMVAEELCPKCAGSKQALEGFIEDFNKLRSQNAILDKENKTLKSQRTQETKELASLKKEFDKVIYERDVYKEDEQALRSQLLKAKKALQETSSSPSRNTKIMEILSSPAIVAKPESSPLSIKETLPRIIEPSPPQEKPSIPPMIQQQPSSSEGIPKRRLNGKSHSREEGEVTPESPAPPGVTKVNERKRTVSPTPPKHEKAKQMDYVYVMSDKKPPPGKMARTEPMLGAQPRPIRRPSPTRYPFDEAHPPVWSDYRMMPRPGGHPPQYPPRPGPPHPSQYYSHDPYQLPHQPMPPNHVYRSGSSGGPPPWHDSGPRPQPRNDSWTGWR